MFVVVAIRLASVEVDCLIYIPSAHIYHTRASRNLRAALRASFLVNKVTWGGVFGLLRWEVRDGGGQVRRAPSRRHGGTRFARAMRLLVDPSLLARVAAGVRGGRAVGLLRDPGHEPLDIGVGLQGFERVVIALELLVAQDGVDVPVAGRAEADGAVDLPPVEGLLVPFVLVARPWDEEVARQPPYRPAAEPALPVPRAVDSVHR